MDVQEWVDALEAECRIGAEFRQFGSDVWTRDLFPGEAQILAAVSNGDCISLQPLDAEFPKILAGQTPIFDCDEPYALSQQWYALTSLANRGVLFSIAANVFRVDEVARIQGCRVRLNGLCDAE